jgi:tRNA isopentenyl-2-thiomethyl-A-37 hydroxylase MiaE
MSKEIIHDLLLAELDRATTLRARFAEDASLSERRALLRTWQAARLARTHQDLLESRRFHDAAEFFLVDLYGPKDLSRRIDDVRRILPVMMRVLPESGLTAVAHSMELNVLSESLDGAMVEALGADAAAISDTTYAAAYRKAGREEDRERQIDLIALLGAALDRLTNQRFIGAALKMMRKPAELAGLGELQAFLERGYRAFGAMRGGAGEFVSIVVGRERSIVKRLQAGDDSVLRWRPQS